MKTPVGDIDVNQIDVSVSFGGEPFQAVDSTPVSMGQGWFHIPVLVPEDLEPWEPVVFRALFPGSPEWRDIHEIMNATPAPWVQDMDARLRAIEQSVDTMADALVKAMGDVQQMFAALSDQIAGLSPSVPELGLVLEDLRITTADRLDPGASPHILAGMDIQGHSHRVTEGKLTTAKGPDNLLLPGESLGAELVEADWGRYDDQKASVVIVDEPEQITIRYDLDGRNQQVWKTIHGLDMADYVLGFRVESLVDGQAEVHVRLHTSPYTPIGFSETIPGNTSVKQRVRLTPQEGVPTRIQFQFGGLHLEPETYTVKDITLKRITKTT